nr:ATP-binding protein [Nocardia terpenica]
MCPRHETAAQQPNSIGEVEITAATVDRLLHHAHLVQTKGDSHRLAEALAGKGVAPLT